MINNNATYVGGVHALPPATFSADGETEISNYPLYYGTAKVVLQGSFPSHITPSTALPSITIVAEDYFGKFVEADSSTLVTFEPYVNDSLDQSSLSILANQKTLKSGIAIFDSLSMTGQIWKNYTVKMSTNLNDDIQTFPICILLYIVLIAN